MDVLKNKKYNHADYVCRLSPFPYYYHSTDKKYIYGVGANIKKDLSYVIHRVNSNDTFESLALKYYNNPTLYWIIADFNDFRDTFITIKDFTDTLKIPNVASISFGDPR